MKTEIVSFYADIDGGTYYSDHAKRLKENCDSHNIPSDIRQLPSRGSYRLNCLTKPDFLLSMMEEKRKPFVWMDVDSIIHDELKIFDDKENVCDVIFAYQSLTPHLVVQKPKASPIYLNNNKIVYEFVSTWVRLCDENARGGSTKVFDHEILIGEVIPQFIKKLRIGVLPINYAIWPGSHIPSNMKPYITMGIADNASKEKSLVEMGMNKDSIDYNLLRK